MNHRDTTPPTLPTTPTPSTPRPGGAYVHGTDPEEQGRLSLLNDLINRRSLAAMTLKRGDRVLDVGAGLGQLTRDMARTTGVRAVGIERSAEQITEGLRKARTQNEEPLIDFRQGDAASLPLAQEEWGSFDVVHTRFLLEHVPDPLAVVKQMVRAARPGGRIILEDDDHDVLRLHPHPHKAWSTWQAYVRLYERLGNDPFVGRRLVSLLHQAGAKPVSNNWVWFGGCAGEATFSALADNFAGILKGARENALRFGLLEPHEFDVGVEELMEWKKLPDASLWFAISWAEGVNHGA